MKQFWQKQKACVERSTTGTKTEPKPAKGVYEYKIIGYKEDGRLHYRIDAPKGFVDMTGSTLEDPFTLAERLNRMVNGLEKKRRDIPRWRQ